MKHATATLLAATLLATGAAVAATTTAHATETSTVKTTANAKLKDAPVTTNGLRRTPRL